MEKEYIRISSYHEPFNLDIAQFMEEVEFSLRDMFKGQNIDLDTIIRPTYGQAYLGNAEIDFVRYSITLPEDRADLAQKIRAALGEQKARNLVF
ncbi:MAG: hypothetical protein Q8Q31_03320 [Nanoarchaeota archaeon]|nr:hypothetical protein [Nanoarchaeota archaeon]